LRRHGGEEPGRVDEDEGEGGPRFSVARRVQRGGSGSGPWRVMRRGLRARVKERLRRARCAEEAWTRIERERGRQRQIPCLTRLGSMRSSARTPRRPRPSFLPSFSLSSRLFSSVAVLSYSFGGLSVFLSLCLSSCPSLRFSFSVSLFSCPSLGRSFSRVSSSVLSCRAADADAGASGIAAIVGAATHCLHLLPFHLSPLRPSVPPPSLPFSKSSVVGRRRNAHAVNRTAQRVQFASPTHPSHPPTNRLPSALHPPLFAASSSTPRSSLATLPLRPSSTGYDIPHTRRHTHTHIHTHPHTHTYICLSPHARIPNVRSNTHVSALSSGRLAASPLSFLFSFPILLPPTSLGLS